MNPIWGERKTMLLSIVGTLTVLCGLDLLLLVRWYAGLLLLVPVGALNVFQLVQCIRWRIQHRE